MFGVISAADDADWGGPDFSEEDLRYEWSLPQLELSRDTWLVEQDGEPCGYAWLLSRDDHRALDGWFVVHPEHRDRGVEPWLVTLMEQRAAEHAAAAAPGAEVHLRVGVIEPDVAGHALLEDRGFSLVRHFWKMAVRLSPAVVEPALPGGISIRPFDPTDTEFQARALFGVHVEAFAGHWGWVEPTFADWRATHVDADDFDPELCFLAWDGEDAVGEAFCHVSGGEGHVATLSVRPDRRGRGIGGALLRWAFAAFARRGLLDVTLEVDSANATGAVALYEWAGMRAKRRYDDYERRLVGSGPPAMPMAEPAAPAPAQSASA